MAPRAVALGLYAPFLSRWLQNVGDPNRFCVLALEHIAAANVPLLSALPHASIEALEREMSFVERCLGVPSLGHGYEVSDEGCRSPYIPPQ